MQNEDKLLIVWTSQDEEVASKMVLLYSSVILERGYWDKATLMIWGPSIKLLAQTPKLQEFIQKIKSSGVKLTCCVVCSDEYKLTQKMIDLGVKPEHTGEFLTQALKNDYKVITF